jgi:haloalkane dehalogenase
LNLFVRGTLRNCVVKPLGDDVRREYLRPFGNWHDRRAVLRFVHDIPLRPGDRLFDDVAFVDSHLHVLANVPTWIGWGLRDFVFDQSFLDEWQRRFPAAEVHACADAGHLVLEDAAAEIVPSVRRFLEERIDQRR